MTDFSFNLLDEKWIPCVDLNGNYCKYGIRELLINSHLLRSIQNQNPLTEAALLRILLAVVHRVINGPRNSMEWKEIYQSGNFNERIITYLQKWCNHFDLFSKETPFYQTPGLVVVDGSGNAVPQPITILMLERASGNNKTLFDHTTSDEPVRLSPGDAAQSLITAQMFSLGGLNKKNTNLFNYQKSFFNSPMVNGIFIVLTGKNFFETLMLNLLIYNDNEPIASRPYDCPVWERTDIGAAITNRENALPPKGYLDFITCKSRHILLIPKLVGDNIFVEHIHIAQGETFSEEPKVRDPGFLIKKNKDKDWYHPKLDLKRMVWRDSTALFAFDDQSDDRPKAFSQIKSFQMIVKLPDRYVCNAYAIANDKANPLAWRKEKLNIPIQVLVNNNTVAYLKKALELSEHAAKVLDDAVNQFMRKYLPKNSKDKDVKEKADATGAIRNYWDSMEEYFHLFLLDLEEPDNALETWVNAIKKTARKSFNLCINGRYRLSMRSFKAWSVASYDLSHNLSIILKKRRDRDDRI